MIAVLEKSKPTNFAELHERLGGVPLERIRLTPYPGSATEADLETNGDATCELIDGVLVEKAMGTREAMLGQWINRVLGNFVEEHDLGVVLGGDGFIKVRKGNVRAPDGTYIPWSAMPENEFPSGAYWSVQPALIFEVLSPTNTKAEIDRKLKELFEIGCRIAWVIDPKTRTATIYTSLTRRKTIDENGILDGGRILPGFQLPMADLFAKLARKKKPN